MILFAKRLRPAYSALIGLLFSGLLLVSTLVHAHPYSPDETAILVNNIIKPTLERNRVPGAALVLYNHGVPQAFYFGTATHSRYNKVNASTIFEIGSITKVFTGLLLGCEANRGQVDLDDPAVMYLRNAPINNRYFDQITLVDLATHVSGLGQMPAHTITNRNSLLKSLKTWRPPYKVNSWWRYSNIGFGVLGYILEDITHQSYQTMLRQQILNPLGMYDTGLTGNSCFNCAQGYAGNGQAVTTTKTLLVIPAAGSIRSSGRDMLKFLAAALNLPGTPLVVAQGMKTTQTPYFQTQYGAQGLGWEIHRFNSLAADGYIKANVRTLTLHSSAAYEVPAKVLTTMMMYDKTGSVAGFRSYMLVIPEMQTGAVLMVNSAMPRTQVVLMVRKLIYQLTHTLD